MPFFEVNGSDGVRRRRVTGTGHRRRVHREMSDERLRLRLVSTMFLGCSAGTKREVCLVADIAAGNVLSVNCLGKCFQLSLDKSCTGMRVVLWILFVFWVVFMSNQLVALTFA